LRAKIRLVLEIISVLCAILLGVDKLLSLLYEAKQNQLSTAHDDD